MTEINPAIGEKPMIQTQTNIHPTFFKKWGSLVILSLALAIIVIDTTLLNVSLGTIIREFNTTIQKIQWVITAYSLILATLTITGGRLGDFFGRKKMFLLGAIIFAIGSFVASIASNVPVLILGEAIIEGIGAALMMPATASLLVSNFQGRDRAVAFGVWGGIAAAASAVGPILGGFLTTHYSWRWGFRINVVVVALLLLGSYLVKESRDHAPKTKEIDWLGIILSASGLFFVVFGIIEASEYGWLKALKPFTIFNYSFGTDGVSIVPYSILIGIIILILFVMWELAIDYLFKQRRMPLVSMKIFKNKVFSIGIITTIVMSLGQSGILFTLPVFFQAVRGLNAFDTGLALLPLSLALLVSAPLSSVIVRKISPKYLIMIGLAINFVAYLVLYWSLSVDATPWTIAPGLAIYGVGMGLIIAQISNITLSAVRVQEAGEASGINSTGRQLGATLGSAIIGAVLLSTVTSHLTSGIEQSTIIPANFKSEIATSITSQTSRVEFGSGANLPSNVPPTLGQEISRISKEAMVAGNKNSFLYGSLIALIGVFVAWFLPKERMYDMKPKAAVSGH